MAQKLTTNLLSHLDFKGYDIVLVKENVFDKKIRPNLQKTLTKNGVVEKQPNKQELIVSTDKKQAIMIAKTEKNSKQDAKIQKKVVNSVKIGVEKTDSKKKNLNINQKINEHDSLKKDSSLKNPNKPAPKAGSVDISKGKESLSPLEKKLKSASKVLVEKKKTGEKTLKNVDLKRSPVEDSKRLDLPLKDNTPNKKLEKSDLSSNMELQNMAASSQKVLEVKTLSKEPQQKPSLHASNLQKTLLASPKSSVKTAVKFHESKNSFQNNSNFNGKGFKDSSKLVKELESKFLKAMSFKRIVDKTKVKITSKTQRMQLTMSKKTHTLMPQLHVANDVVVSDSKASASIAQSPKADVPNVSQKPLDTNPNIIQRFENVQKISNMIKSLTPQNKSMMMRLDPPNLGSVEVRLVTHGKEVLVNFIVKDNDLKDVIKNTSQLLTGQLKLNTNYQKIQINVQTQDNQNQQQGQQEHRGNQQQQNQQQRYYQNQEDEEVENDS